jgi:hypothetical protein
MNSVTFGNKFAKALDADHHQKVLLKFAVIDKGTKERMKVHQVRQPANVEITYLQTMSQTKKLPANIQINYNHWDYLHFYEVPRFS